jgi:hypothetical protein
MALSRTEARKELAEIRRRLGPFTALQCSSEPWRLNEAEIARRLCEVIRVLDDTIASLPSHDRA